MAKKICVEPPAEPDRSPPAMGRVDAVELQNPMSKRTKLVLTLEPLMAVVLALALWFMDHSLILPILAIALFSFGPITTFYSDRKFRPRSVRMDDDGVTPVFGPDSASIPWSIVVLVPRGGRGSDGRFGGFLGEEGRQSGYLVTNEIFLKLADGYGKRTGKRPW